MVQSVEMLLADEDEQGVWQTWRRLLDAGLPSQATHTSPSNRPHTTLVAVPRLRPEAEDRLRDVVAGRLPVTGRWGPVHRFGRGPWVLVRLVEPSDDLRRLQADLAAVCEVPPDSLSAPDHWRAHVTLARRVTESDWSATSALAEQLVADTAPEGSPVTLTTVRRWDSEARREWTVGQA